RRTDLPALQHRVGRPPGHDLPAGRAGPDRDARRPPADEPAQSHGERTDGPRTPGRRRQGRRRAGVSAATGVDAERRTPQVRLRPILITLGVVVLVMVSLRFVAEPMRVSSDSMSPTFSTGDEVLVQKTGAHARKPSVGDVVVVRSPASGDLMIKRVAAVGG